MSLKINKSILILIYPYFVFGQYNFDRTVIEPNRQDELFNFGRSSAIGDFNGDGLIDVVIADPSYTSSLRIQGGRVFLFWGNNSNLPPCDYTIIEEASISAYSNFGRFLKSWDLNQDGFDDLIIPAFRDSIDGFRKVGRVFVYYGSKVFDKQSDLIINSPLLEDAPQFGSALSIGDLNGDRYWDLIIGAHLGDPSGIHDAGCAFVYFGSVTGLKLYPSLKLTESILETYPYSGPEFGRDIAVCDFNNDGYDDLFISAAWGSVDSTEWAGRISVFLGSSAFDNQVDHILIEKEPSRAQILGWSLSCGDLNADGYDDLIAGAPRADIITGTLFRGDSVGTEGRINIFWGSKNISETRVTVLTEAVPQLGAHLGRDGLIVIDINEDGQKDILAAATYYDNGSLKDAGRVSVFLNTGNGFAPGDDILLPGASLAGLSMAASASGYGLLVCAVNQAIWFQKVGITNGTRNRTTDFKSLTVYPNPAGDKLQIVLPYSLHLDSFQVRVQNFYSQVLRQYKISGTEQVEVDLQGLPSGMYIVGLYSGYRLISSSYLVHE